MPESPCDYSANSILGLLERTNYPMSRLLNIHGALQLVHCTACDYKISIQKPEDLPFLQSLSTATDRSHIVLSDLPHCPKCTNLLRPGVIWFGERLAAGAPDSIDKWLLEDGIDLVIAAGTSLEVYPAAEWVTTARANGASLAIIDLDKNHRIVDELNNGDLFFRKDIAMILPKVLDLLKSRWKLEV